MNEGLLLARTFYDAGRLEVFVNIWRLRASGSNVYWVGDPHGRREAADQARVNAPRCYFVPYRFRIRMKVRP